MADTSLIFDVLAVDRASAVFNRIAGKGEEMGSRLGRAAKLAGAGVAAIAASVVAVGFEVGKIGFEEFTKNQKAVAQLDAVVKSTGGSAGVTSDKVQKLADKIQNYSGQTHESIDASAALLLQFGNIKDTAGPMGDVFDRATAITADMAARMGGSASDNAIKLGRALTNPTQGLSALTRVGVTFTQAQKDQIKAMQDSGNMAGAQNLVLDALTQKYGGAAEAAGKTLPGQLSRAKLALEDVAASIVAKLIPVVTSLLSWINDKLIPGLKSFWQQHGPQVKQAFSDIGDVITKKVVPVVKDIAEKVWPMLVQGFKDAEKAWTNTLKPALVDAADHISNKLKPILMDITSWWQNNHDAVDRLTTKAKDFVSQLVAIYVEIDSFLLAKLIAIGTWFGGVVIDDVQTLARGVEDLYHAFQDIVSIGDKAAGILGNVSKAVGGGISSVTKHLPHLATGGLVTQPTIAMIGESGPELVIPMSSSNGAGIKPLSGTAAGGLTVVFNGPIVGGSPADAQKLAGYIFQALTSQALQHKARNGVPAFG